MENLENEVWKDIIDYNGEYQISNLGRIKSFKYNTPKILAPYVNSTGYVMAYLQKGPKRKGFLLHRQIAIHFIPNLENKPCINHRNGIKTDNSLSNLEWCTYSENMKHAFDNGLNKHTDQWRETMKENGTKLINPKTGKILRSIKELAVMIGKDRSCVSRMLSGENKNITGFTYLIEALPSEEAIDTIQTLQS